MERLVMLLKKCYPSRLLRRASIRFAAIVASVVKALVPTTTRFLSITRVPAFIITHPLAYVPRRSF